MKPTDRSPLAKAVAVHARILAALASRLLERNDTSCLGGYIQPSGALVIVAVGERASRIAGELQRADLLTPQQDKKKPAAA